MPSGNHLYQYKLSIAGITIQFAGDENLEPIVPDIHRAFMVDEGEPDFCLKVHYRSPPPLKLEQKLFDSGSVWALYRGNNGGYIITLLSYAPGPTSYHAAVIDSSFRSGDLYIKPLPDTRETSEPGVSREDYSSHVLYLIYPLLMLNLLPRGRGIELHSCGVNYQGHGMIFTGPSGAGKSTLAKLWKNDKDALVLSDERIIIRRIDGRFWMFGTPWQSSAATSSPEGVPLEKIFFIKHNSENHALPMKAGDAASGLFVRCYPTFWDESCLDYTLGFIGQITEQVPCYELGFVPNRSVLDFVKRIASGDLLI